MKNEIHLETQTDVARFVDITSKLPGQIWLEGEDQDGVHCVVSARSLLGAAYSMFWTRIFVNADHDIYEHIKEFVV